MAHLEKENEFKDFFDASKFNGKTIEKIRYGYRSVVFIFTDGSEEEIIIFHDRIETL